MNFPTYTLETPKGTVTYGYVRAFRKWSFQVNDGYRLLVACRGGEQGHKVARIVAGSVKQSGKVTQFARNNIDRIVGV